MIDVYLAELDRALRGPRRAKVDLLTEARDSLIDAAEAYQAGGLCRPEAERMAMRDFGLLEEIVPGYQAELALSQGRRTELLVLFVFAAQPFIWGYAFRWVTGTSPEDPRTDFQIADDLVEKLGGITILVSLLAVLVYRIGMRVPAVRDRLARATGIGALVVAVVFTAFSVVLTVYNAKLLVINLVWTVAFILIPVSWIAVSARRCLTWPAAARRPPAR